jgi:hypothetical protein
MFVFSFSRFHLLCCNSCSMLISSFTNLSTKFFCCRWLDVFLDGSMNNVFFHLFIVTSNANNHFHQHLFSSLQCLICYIPLLSNIIKKITITLVVFFFNNLLLLCYNNVFECFFEVIFFLLILAFSFHFVWVIFLFSLV